jgi:hypothetical protein
MPLPQGSTVFKIDFVSGRALYSGGLDPSSAGDGTVGVVGIADNVPIAQVIAALNAAACVPLWNGGAARWSVSWAALLNAQQIGTFVRLTPSP